MKRCSLLRKSLIFGVSFVPYHPKKSFFDLSEPCTILVYITGNNGRPVKFTFGKDDEAGYNAFIRFKDELNNKESDDVVDIYKIMFNR